ncbi:MAG: hypothetical protein HC882_07565 [Acidobacteria bacterium]|nr:hypothetical protein [Acidobacteriota bacterium]
MAMSAKGEERFQAPEKVEDGARFRPGVVPPPGPLPQAFGLPPAVLWIGRLSLVGILLVALSETGLDFVRNFVNARRLSDIIVPALAALFFLLRRLGGLLRGGARKGLISAVGIVVEPLGIVIHGWISKERFTWGEIAGVQVIPDTNQEALRVVREGRVILIVPATMLWGERFLALMSGRVLGDGRFDAVARAAPTLSKSFTEA